MKQSNSFRKTSPIPSLAISFCAILVCLFSALPQAQAHPHVFIEEQLGVVFDEKGLSGIKVRWKFDEMYSSMIAGDYDLNRNGKLEAKEVTAIKDKVFSNFAASSYFCFIKIENQPFKVTYIKDFKAVLDNNELIYEFFIPCHVPAARNLRKVSVATYDPSYYHAISFAEKDPVFLISANAYAVKTVVREDPEIKFYYNMINPETLYLEFRKKP
jgi:ABC-type uncharacterized transport system substrate-binding protein